MTRHHRLTGTRRIRRGGPAGLVLLDSDPCTPDPNTLRSLTVTTTIVGGRIAFGHLGTDFDKGL